MANNSRAVQSQMLCDAALENDVNVLRDLLSKDAFLLGRSSPSPNTCSPLHIACKEGCLEFVMELLKERPVLCEELDSNRSSPLHISSQNGHSQLIQPLVEAKPTMCFSRDMMGMTPFHLAAMNGYLPVLEKLLSLMPVAARERVGGVDRDTILHLCVKYNQLDALKMVIEVVGEAEFLNAKDGDGNSILHLAAANYQSEVFEELLNEKRLNKNSLNSNGWTAMDIVVQRYVDFADLNQEVFSDGLRRILKKGGAFPSTDIGRDAETDMYLSWFESQRSALIVAASLVLTVAFQTGLNPPSGAWRDAGLNNNNNSTTTGANQTAAHSPRSSEGFSQTVLSCGFFLCFNTLCLFSAMSSLVLLLLPLPPRRPLLSFIRRSLYMTLFYLTLAYSIAVYSMTYGQRMSVVAMVPLIIGPLFCAAGILVFSWLYGML